MSASSIRSLRWIDYVFHAFVDPRQLARQLAGHAKVIPVLVIIPISIAACEIIALSLLSNQNRFFFYKMSYGWIGLSLVFIVSIIGVVLLTDFSLQMISHGGIAVKLCNAAFFSLLPHLFVLPALSIFTVLSFAPVLFYVLIEAGFMVWSILLFVTFVSEMTQLPFGRAFACFFIPAVVLFFTTIFSLVCTFALLYGKILFL